MSEFSEGVYDILLDNQERPRFDAVELTYRIICLDSLPVETPTGPESWSELEHRQSRERLAWIRDQGLDPMVEASWVTPVPMSVEGLKPGHTYSIRWDVDRECWLYQEEVR